MTNSDRLRAALDNCPHDSEPVPIQKPKNRPLPARSNRGDIFPIDVYPESIAGSFRELSVQYNIPLDYLGLTGLFTVAGLAGGMFKGDLNGGIKPILYSCLVGPSGVGKTPAYKQLCENIISPLRASYYHQYKLELKAWQQERELAKTNKMPFTRDQPVKKVRMITDATLEALTKYAELCPAGFGVVYDEGGRFFTSANAYKKDTSSIDFWNELWNGTAYEILRVDSERDRHIMQSATSVIIGMQRDRLLKFFNEDTIASGLLNRFLIVDSDYILLNEDVDPFQPKSTAHDSWSDLVKYLFAKGVQFVQGTEQLVRFEDIAKDKYTLISKELTLESNKSILAAKQGDTSRLMVAYVSKLTAYLPRLALILAIIDNPQYPVIRYENIINAKRLYHYFKETANRVLFSINDTSNSGLNENCKKLYDALPNMPFTSLEAEIICEELNFDRTYFLTNYNRIFSKGFVKRLERGIYEKV